MVQRFHALHCAQVAAIKRLDILKIYEEVPLRVVDDKEASLIGEQLYVPDAMLGR